MSLNELFACLLLSIIRDLLVACKSLCLNDAIKVFNDDSDLIELWGYLCLNGPARDLSHQLLQGDFVMLQIFQQIVGLGRQRLQGIVVLLMNKQIFGQTSH